MQPDPRHVVVDVVGGIPVIPRHVVAGLIVDAAQLRERRPKDGVAVGIHGTRLLLFGVVLGYVGVGHLHLLV